MTVELVVIIASRLYVMSSYTFTDPACGCKKKSVCSRTHACGILHKSTSAELKRIFQKLLTVRLFYTEWEKDIGLEESLVKNSLDLVSISHRTISHSNQCFTTDRTKAVVYTILSLGWWL